MNSTEKNFRVSKCKKYFQTHILKFKPGNVAVSVHMSTMQLHQDRQATEKYMKFILDMEQSVIKELDKRNLAHDPMKVIVYSINLISSWVDNFDIRHDLPIEQQAILVVNWFDNAFNKAKEVCEKILAELKEKPVSYVENWRAHDAYNQNNELFELGMEKLDVYYGNDPLDNIMEKSNKMLELLIKLNKQKKENNEI